MRILLLLLLSLPALAAPTLHARNGQSVRVVLGEKRERGIGLRPAHSEWRLLLDRSDGDSADVIDLTAGTGARWQVTVADGALRFDAERFVADHAYLVQLRRGPRALGSAIVYLYPPKAEARQQLQFDDEQAPPDGEMATIPKPTL